jgi:hypothetical protein
MPTMPTRGTSSDSVSQRPQSGYGGLSRGRSLTVRLVLLFMQWGTPRWCTRVGGWRRWASRRWP